MLKTILGLNGMVFYVSIGIKREKCIFRNNYSPHKSI